MTSTPIVAGIATLGVGFLVLMIGLFAIFASIIPLDIDRYKRWTFEQMYYNLYPMILRDFMAKPDCAAVHGIANMTVATNSGPKPVVHALQGGSDIQGKILEARYRAQAETGTGTLEQARRTGEFTGIPTG